MTEAIAPAQRSNRPRPKLTRVISLPHRTAGNGVVAGPPSPPTRNARVETELGSTKVFEVLLDALKDAYKEMLPLTSE